MEVILNAKDKSRSELGLEERPSRMVEWEQITEIEKIEYCSDLIKEVQNKCKNPIINRILEYFVPDRELGLMEGHFNVLMKLKKSGIDFLPKNLFLLICLLDHRGTKATMTKYKMVKDPLVTIFNIVSSKMTNLMPNKCGSCRKWYAVPHWVVPEVECLKCGRGRHDCKPPLQPKKNKEKAIWLCSTCGYVGAVNMREEAGGVAPTSHRFYRDDKQTKMTRFFNGIKRKVDSTMDEKGDEDEVSVIGNRPSLCQNRRGTIKEGQKLTNYQIGDEVDLNLLDVERNNLLDDDFDSSNDGFDSIPDVDDFGESESESDYDTDDYEYFKTIYARGKRRREFQGNGAHGFTSAQKIANNSNRMKSVRNTKDLPKFVKNARRKKGVKADSGNKNYTGGDAQNLSCFAGTSYDSPIRGTQMKKKTGSRPTCDAHTKSVSQNKNDEVVAVNPNEVEEAIGKVNIDAFLGSSENPIPFITVLKSQETMGKFFSSVFTQFLNERTLVDDYTKATTMLLFKRI